MGIEQLLTPTIINATMAGMGLTAARLDYDRRTDILYLSLARHGQIHHIRIPIGITFTRDEICELLSDRPAAQIRDDQHEAAPAKVAAAANSPPA
jgi:hypothetical protein